MTETRYPCPHCEGELLVTSLWHSDADKVKISLQHSQTIKLQVKV